MLRVTGRGCPRSQFSLRYFRQTPRSRFQQSSTMSQSQYSHYPPFAPPSYEVATRASQEPVQDPSDDGDQSDAEDNEEPAVDDLSVLPQRYFWYVAIPRLAVHS